ncbi:hypothetical protein Cfor_10143 [Coptotermes formosanus]|uniref:phosphoglycerate mutase (2,3-diphosphoglycerate-dependent) n=1 Tax=Coptotermes formosanus TaxID=36987 RepID=A0A6L2PW41_COPFO|nr:hypothetical protein Cfor_10143 [Coptotermes formosanus]
MKQVWFIPHLAQLAVASRRTGVCPRRSARNGSLITAVFVYVPCALLVTLSSEFNFVFCSSSGGVRKGGLYSDQRALKTHDTIRQYTSVCSPQATAGTVSTAIYQLNSNIHSAVNFGIKRFLHGDINREDKMCLAKSVNIQCNGKEEARQAAAALNTENLQFDVAYTSVLRRAHDTLDIILREIRQPGLPVQIWRRSFDVRPPPMEKHHKYYNEIVNNPKFRSIKGRIPQTESLKTTMLRVIPFWNSAIVADIKSGKRVLVVCHGTSLRGIVKHVGRLSDDAITRLNLPTGIPFIFEFDADFKPIASMKFLSDEDTVQKAMEKVASIGRAPN